MAHDSSAPSRRRHQKPEAPPNEDERWKTSPSTETTSDEGHNARLANKRKREEDLTSPEDASRPSRRDEDLPPPGEDQKSRLHRKPRRL